MNTKKILHIMLFVLTILYGTNNFATNYYVSNQGNDSNNGNGWTNAFLTIQHAANLVSVGDTVFVNDGIYSGFDLRNTNGSNGNPIVFIGVGNNIIINQSGPVRDDGINIENANFIIVDGFVVNNMTGIGNGIRVVNANNCIVKNCSCNNNAKRGIFTAFTDDILIEYNICSNSVSEHGIYVSNSSDRPVIRFNECFGNNATGIHLNGDLSAGGNGIISDAIIYGNILHDNNGAAGINMDGLQSPIIYNNIIFNNHFAQGIAVFQQDGAIMTNDAKIFNNTIIVPTDGRWGILLKSGANVNTEIYNNIIINQHAWRGCIAIEDTSQFASNYNILNDKMSDSGDGTTISLSTWQALGFDVNSLLANSLSLIFTDPSINDYHLIVNSQAIDTGTNLVASVVFSDIEGNIRPFGVNYDIGAYEYSPVSSVSEQVLNQSKVFPNPVKLGDNITITYSNTIDKVTIYSLQGQKLYDNKKTEFINTRILGKGSFIIIISQNNGIMFSNKLIVN